MGGHLHGFCVTDYCSKISSLDRNTRPRLPAAARKPVLWGGVIKVKTRCFLHMAKAVAAKMFAAVPAGDNNQLAHPLGPLQHAQDHHPSATFPIIRLQRHTIEQNTPAVMSRFGIFLVPLQIAERHINLCPIFNCAAGNRIFRAAITEDYPNFLITMPLAKGSEPRACSSLCHRGFHPSDPIRIARMGTKEPIACIGNAREISRAAHRIKPCVLRHFRAQAVRLKLKGF